MKIDIKYKEIWDKYSDQFGRTIFHPQFFAKKYAWEIVDEAQKKSHGVLLDIGCGRMPYRPLILPKVKKYIGADHPSTAKMYHGDVKPDIYADATKIPLKTRSIDTILSLMVFEHLPHPELAMQEMKRLLKPNGVVLLSTVQMYPIHDAPHDYFRYSRYGLSNLFHNAGFKILKIKSQGSFWGFWALSFNVFLFKIILSMMKNNQKYLAIVMLPFFYGMSLAMNIIFYLPEKISNPKKSLFNISHFVLAKTQI